MTVVYLSPAGPNTFIGGVRKLYDQSSILNRFGIPSRVVRTDLHEELTLAPDDLLVIPETEGDMLRRVAPGIRKVSLNQNAYYSFVKVGDPKRHPYLDNPDLVCVITVSDDSEKVLRYVFPDLRIERIRTAADPDGRFSLGGFPRPRQICYFARKRSECSQFVLGALHARGELDGWTIVAMDGMSDQEVADTYATSAIFLAMGRLEGRQDPPLEALLSGCRVIGFRGFGASEYQNWIRWVPEDDLLAFCYALSEVMRQVDDDWVKGIAATHSHLVAQHYSRAAEEEHLVKLFTELIG